ncbi:MAG: hypothetical protein VXW02_12525 [Verrucomicrobiota bacterium]|nr:hypothetical protein [Verrucomicrobiota bacterium]
MSVRSSTASLWISKETCFSDNSLDSVGMKKPIIFSVLLFITTATSSFGQFGFVTFEELDSEIRNLKQRLESRIQRNESKIFSVENDFLSLRSDIVINGSKINTNLLNIDKVRNDLEIQTSNINVNTSEIAELKQIVEALGNNDTSIGEQLTSLGQNDTSIGEQLTSLGQNDISIGEQIQVLQDWQASIQPQIWDFKSEHDVGIAVNKLEIESNKTEINSIQTEMETMKAQLQTLVASVAEKDAQIAEKDAKIAELEQGGGGQSIEEVLEQVRDARAGSVVLTVDPEGDNITLGLTIEQSDNLIEWTKLDGEMTRTIPIPDGKKFYRFALDK